MKTVALIVAAGQGTRLGGDVPKQFRIISGRPLLSWTIDRFEKSDLIDEIVLVVAEEYLLYANEKIVNPYEFNKLKRIIKGGATRQESVYRGLKALPISTGFVAIHDGARPLTDTLDIGRTVAVAQECRAAVLGRSVADTIKRVEGDYIIATIDRSRLFRAETPQVFQYDLILSAHERSLGKKDNTDDASMVEAIGFKVKMVPAQKPNMKITTEDDLEVAKLMMGKDR